MARDVTVLGPLDTGTTTRAGAISGNEDLFNLPGRGIQLRATAWYTFSLPATATSIIIRSTGNSDMVGGLYGGTVTPTSDIADLGSQLAFNDDAGGGTSNFQISRTNEARGAYTLAVQKFATGAAIYALEIVAVIRGIQDRDASVTLEAGLPTASIAAERVAPSVPARPSRPTARRASLTSLSVSWPAPADGGAPITDYDVRYRAGGSGPWTTWPHVGIGATATITGLAERTSYQVQVRAQNRIGESAYSLSASGDTTPDPTAPARPARPAVRGATSSTLIVQWVAPTDDGGAPIADYGVRYREGTSGAWTTWPFTGAGTATTITGLMERTSYQVQVRAENSVGESTWSLSGAATTEAIMAVLAMEIDWDNDGSFSHVASDVTADLVKLSLRTTRGRTLQSRRKAVAGRLECKLWNLNAKYDPINSSSPIFERDVTGVGVRVKMADTVVWGGILDTPRYRNRPVPQMDIIALGLISTLRQSVSVATQANQTTGEIAQKVGRAIGIGTAGLIGGGKPLDRWAGVSDQDALGVLQDLEETEEGFFYERADGTLALDGEDARLRGAGATSALTISDQIVSTSEVPILRGSALDWGYRQISNVVHVQVEPLVVGVEIQLFVAIRPFTIQAGKVVTIAFSYPNLSAPPSHKGVAGWVRPVAGTDYTAQSGLFVGGIVDGDRYRVALRNTSTSAITIPAGGLKVRGTPLIAGDPARIEAKDAASIRAFGEREYARPAPLFTDIGAAQEYADGIVNRQKSPQGWLVARWPAYTDVANARALDLSRRITVERLGEAADYFIEGIGLALPDGYVRMEYLLSPVPGVTVPSAPLVAMTPVAGQPAHLAVSWTEPYNGGAPITDYDVRYRKSTDRTWATWSHSGAARTTTITGREPGGVAYDVQVRAENRVGEGLWSASVTGGTGSQIPHAPGAPTATGYSGRIAVAWTEPYSGGAPITDYDVRYKKSSASTWTALAHSGTSRTASITGLRGADAYDVQVRAENRFGESQWSDSGTASTIARAPNTPGAPSLRGYVGGIAITWNAPSDDGGADVTDYDVRYKKSTASTWTALTYSGTRILRITGLRPSDTYEVQVRAQNSEGWSSWSSSGTGSSTRRPDPPPPPVVTVRVPGAPGAPSVSGRSGGVTVSWSAPSSNGGADITTYELRYATTSNTSWRRSSSTQISAASGETVIVQVRARNRIGWGPWSGSGSATAE